MRRMNWTAIACVLALGATPAWAQDDSAEKKAPETDMALLFSLNNPFVSPAILSTYRGFGLGAMLELGPEWSVRMGVDITHTTNPPRVSKVTTTTGTDVVTSFTVTVSGPTSVLGVSLGADLIKRLGSSALAPYIGVGLAADTVDARTRYTDDVSVPDQVTGVNDLSASRGVIARGLAGIVWRFHDSFSVFVEYALALTIFRWTTTRGETTIQNSVSGTPTTTRTESEATVTRWLNVDTSLAQGASLGLMAHF